MLCGESAIGTASFGARIRLKAVQMPAGGAVVSVKPMETSDGAWIPGAQLTVSK